MSLEGNTSFHIETLIGKRHDEGLEVFVRQLAELYSKISPKPILVSLAIKEENETGDMDPLKCKKIIKAIYEETIKNMIEEEKE